MFSQVCVCSTFRGGGSSPTIQTWPGGSVGGGYPRSGLGGTPSQVQMVGGIPSQVWMVGGGYPIPGLDGGIPRVDVPMVPHHDWMGYPHHHDWMEYSPNHDWMGYPPPNSKASTCYVVGSMPLAFTQEDFLVK